MTMKVYHVLFVLIIALLSVRLGASAPDWVRELNDQLNAMTRDLQQHTQELTRNLQQQRQELTRNIRQQTQDLIKNLQQQRQELTRNLQQQRQDLTKNLAEVDKVIANLPKDAQRHTGLESIITNGQMVITYGDNTIRMSSANGVSQTIISGYMPDGEPYVRHIQEKTDGKYFYHNEDFFNPKTNVTAKIHWKLDLTSLTTQGAKPEIIIDEK